MFINFNFQNDSKWKNETMQDKDTLGQYGCLVSSLANIIQDFKGVTFTPKDLNNLIKEKKLYFISNGLTSFLKTDDLLKLFGLNRYELLNKKVSGHLYYYAKVILGGVGHFINIISQTENHYIGYDVYDGKLKLYGNDEIKTLTGVSRI